MKKWEALTCSPGQVWDYLLEWLCANGAGLPVQYRFFRCHLLGNQLWITQR
ncbi:MAG: hypothetical protein GYA34_14380 [Chloroflexi bacterium]|nr:hypothetical protein [Chloroflexota bacterium]